MLSLPCGNGAGCGVTFVTFGGGGSFLGERGAALGTPGLILSFASCGGELSCSLEVTCSLSVSADSDSFAFFLRPRAKIIFDKS